MNKTKKHTIRVDINKLDMLMNVVGELVITRTGLNDVVEQIKQDIKGKAAEKKITVTMKQFHRLSNELQELVTKLRMVPIKILFEKIPRIIRDTSKRTNKRVKLSLFGEETEIDRTVIEKLTDPIMHIVRNSIDHGIELPEDRINAGKPEFGNIKINAYHDGNNIVIEISDDGQGISLDSIKASILEHGLFTPQQLQQMSDQEILNQIFNPGFSTKSVITEVSGRGVGLDVVKNNIENLKGIIDIQTEQNVGTTIIIKFPLTLTIIEALLIKNNHGNIYALPLSNILEIIEVKGSQIENVNQEFVYRLREQYISLFHFSVGFKESSATIDKNKKYNIVFVGLAEKRLGFIVDEVIGKQEIVVKTLGSYLGDVKYISGVTILGSGQAICIVDIPTILKSVLS